MQRLKKFQEGMSSDDIEEKLRYVSQVVDVANEIGKAETISSLIPFLNDWCPDNDDEALTKLATELYKLNSVFEPDEMKYVLPILKHLATTEEVVVRDAAVDSINKIVKDMPPAVVREELVKHIEDLCHDEWFTPRVSACSLIAEAYSRIMMLSETEDVSESLKTLRDCFFGLCKDDTPMVRRAAAKNMRDVFAACDDSSISLFVVQFEAFFSDEDVIKMYLMPFTKDLLKRVVDENDRKTVLNIFHNNLEARSYKIREAATLEVTSITEILGSDVFSELLLEPFLKLFKDNNNDVKCTAIKQTPSLAKIIPKDVFAERVYPFLTGLAADRTPVITETIASVVVDLSTVYPDLVTSLITSLLDDPLPQVRLIFLQRLNEIQLNEYLIRRLVLEETMEGPNWRVREEVAKHMSCLLVAAKDTPQMDLLLTIYLHLFEDGVSKVRETCRHSLSDIFESLGADFAFTKILAPIEKAYNETNSYLLLFNFLYTYQVVIRLVPNDERVTNMYTTLLKEMNNAVPNLRFICCRIFADLADVLPDKVKTDAITKMKELENDSDRDVRYYAALGLKQLA